MCPLSRRLDDGRYAAVVSIRTGRGRESTDRVMRFNGTFASEEAACRYAREQGLIWVSAQAPAPLAGAGTRLALN